ncbi:MAG: hypothetical protein AMS22_05135 [Thiotrichales bacterium SG8_50]|nr:MAG: hypothetical protein AMS22_05135 [Thiotrichales bacterium SG8_50]
MSAISEWFDNQVVLGIPPRSGPRRVAYQEITQLIKRNTADMHPSFEFSNEIQGVTSIGHVFSKYTLTITDPNGIQATSSEIDTGNDQQPNVVNTAINNGCNGVIPGYQNGDIVRISGSVSTTSPLLISYVGGDFRNWGDLQGEFTYFNSGPLATVTYRHGQSTRYTWAVLYALGLIGLYDLPPQGHLLPKGFKLLNTPDKLAWWPSASLRMMLAKQAAIEDNNPALEDQLLDLLNVE